MRGLFTMRLIETTAVDEALVAAVLDFLERALTPALDSDHRDRRNT
jgi:hypothetical protein